MTNQEKLQKFLERAAEKGRGVAGKIEGEVSEFKNQIERLLDEKNELDRGPLTKEEVLSACKKSLRDGLSEEFLNGLLVPHLKDVQLRRVNFLQASILSIYFTEPRLLGKWFFGILNEELLSRAVQSLPDIGIPAHARQKKIAEIEKRISDLEGQIEKLLS